MLEKHVRRRRSCSVEVAVADHGVMVGILNAPLSASDTVSILRSEFERDFVEVSVNGFLLISPTPGIVRASAWLPQATPQPPVTTGGNVLQGSRSGGATGGIVVLIATVVGVIGLIVVAAILVRRRRSKVCFGSTCLLEDCQELMRFLPIAWQEHATGL